MTQLTQELFGTVDWLGKIYAGQWSNSLGGQHQVVEPATGQALATVGIANREHVATSAAAAKGAQKAWAKQAPQERAAVAGGLIVARVFEEAGLPAGVLHVLPGGGEAGQALAEDPNIAMISFTGSPRRGGRWQK